MVEATSKREAFEIIYQNLTQVQDSYRRMIHHCSQQMWESKDFLEQSDEERQIYEHLGSNIQIAEDSFIRLERIKYHTSIAILTEGVCATEEDLVKAIEEVDILLKVSEIESKAQDDEIKTWANDKIQHLENTRGVLLQVLTHKASNKAKRNPNLYQ